MLGKLSLGTKFPWEAHLEKSQEPDRIFCSQRSPKRTYVGALFCFFSHGTEKFKSVLKSE
uniref:Uncharacterized protein n=1 Tax=Setaria italica TaxID=4555 RepID=K3YNS2_SETIT